MKESKMAERLQKVIAQAGVASRRKAEKMISAGQVTVNGKKITELGTKVEPSDKIEVNGVPIEKETLHTYLFYKPRGVISSVKDDKGRKTVVDFLKMYHIVYIQLDVLTMILLAYY